MKCSLKMVLKKKYNLFLVIFIHNVFLCGSETITTKFLTDFFKDKNVMITTNFCWDYSNLKRSWKSLSGGNNPKLTSIYNNSTKFDHFVDYLSTSNYFVLDLHYCPSSWNLLQKANEENWFRHPLKWLLLINALNFDILKTHLANYSILPSSDVIVVKREENLYELLQPYRIDHIKEIIWENYGSWSQENGLEERLYYVPLPQRRSNLQEIEMNLSLAIRDEDSVNHLEDFRYLNVDRSIKQSWFVIKCLLEYCNASYRFLEAESEGYFDRTTGNWSGVTGDLYYGRAQLSASTLLIDSERLHAVEFLAMLNPSKISFVLKRPAFSYMSNIFVLSFNRTVWIAIAVVLCLFALALLVILNWETKYRERLNCQENFGINDVFLIVFETLCQQGTMTEPRTISGRTITLIFLTGFMFLYVAYSANIVALLQSTTEITSLGQLLNSRLAVGCEDMSYLENYLTDDIRKELYEKKIKPNRNFSLQDGIDKVQSGFFAFHMELGLGYHYILKKFTDYEMCGIEEVEGYAKFPDGYACVPKNSPYNEIILVGLLKIEEYGLRRRNYNRVFREPSCYSKSATFGDVGIMDAYPAIMLWIYGTIFAALIFLLEKLLQGIRLRRTQLFSDFGSENCFEEEIY